MADQWAANAFAAHAGLARSNTLGFLRLVRLLTLRRRQAGIVRGFTRLDEPRLKLGDALLGRLKALPQCPDQGVLFGVAQGVEVGKLGHGALRIEPDVIASSPFLQTYQYNIVLSIRVPPQWG
jgi:hypothetical protein